MALRALKTDEEIAGVPLDQPILVELPGGVGDDIDNTDGAIDKPAGKAKEEPDGAKVLQEQLEASQRAQEAERTRADKAERDAADARKQAAEADKRSATLESDVITGGLAAAQNELAAAEAELERAGEAGDFKAMAKAQSRIGRASAQVVNLESGAAEIAERPKPEDRKEPTQERQLGWAEQVRANPNLLEAERTWMLKHETSFKDPDFNKKLDFAYQGAMRNGTLVRGSQAYFDYIERQTGLVTDAGGNDDDNQGSRDVQAPPSRNERDGTGRASDNKMRLEPEERAIAASMGVSETEYARNKQRLYQEMKSDPEKYGRR